MAAFATPSAVDTGEIQFPESSILVAGCSQVGKSSNLFEVCKVVSVQLVIDRAEDRILAAHCSVFSNLTCQFIHQLLAGQSLTCEADMDVLMERLEKRIYIITKGPVLQAFRNALLKYLELRTV